MRKRLLPILFSEGSPPDVSFTLTPLDQLSPLTQDAHGAVRQPGEEGIILDIFMGTSFCVVCTVNHLYNLPWTDFGPAPSQAKG